MQKSFHTGRNLNIDRYFPKRVGMAETDWYGLEFISRWIKGASQFVLLSGTVFFSRSSRNGVESTTLVKARKCSSLCL